MTAGRGLSGGRELPLYLLATMLAVFVYFFGLDGRHIPRNGDEEFYEQVTRLTAESGRLLPLRSELDGMHNPKPPLLFWQGIASTRWGREWTPWRLRTPTVLYTLATAALVFLLGWKSSGDPSKGFVGALAFLAFFSTYRYGRPFLTDPPEVFWLFLPLFTLLYWRETAFSSRRLPALLGVMVGIGLLYKSFAFVVPVGLCLAWWYLRERGYRLGPFLALDAWKVALVATISLGLFGLWFALDPEPRTIWREFVVGENVGQFDPHPGSYLAGLLRGGSSAWTVAAALPVNAGLLAFPVLGLIVASVRRRERLGDDERMLWIWLIVLLVVSSLPSHRSTRYLLPAMPALAVLWALGWQRIGRPWFVATLGMVALVVVLMAYGAGRLQAALPEAKLYGTPYWSLLGGTLLFAAIAALAPALTRPGTPVASLLALLSLAASLQPFDGPLGTYGARTRTLVSGREVWVPFDFNAKYEAHRFLLPGALVRGYREERPPDVADLARRYPTFAVVQPLGEGPCPGCTVLGERLELRDRHTSAEIGEMLAGRLSGNLFVREVIYSSPSGARAAGLPRDYVDVAMLRDVVERYGTGNVSVLRWLVRHLLGNAASPLSVENFHATLRSQGFKVGRDSLHEMLAQLQDCFLVRTVWMESSSERQRMVNPRKAYPVDPGLIPVFDRSGRSNVGHALETAVLVELERRHADVTWVRTPGGYEVDFLARNADGSLDLIQVSADPSSPETAGRELRALEEAHLLFPGATGRLLVLTADALPPALPKGILAQPAYDWMLEPTA